MDPEQTTGNLEEGLPPPMMDIDCTAAPEIKQEAPVAMEQVQRLPANLDSPTLPTTEQATANPEPNDRDDKAMLGLLDPASDRPLGTAEDVSMDVTENEGLKEARQLPSNQAPSEPPPGERTSYTDHSPAQEMNMPVNRPPVDSFPSPPSAAEPSTRSPASNFRLPQVSYVEAQTGDRPLNVSDALSYLDAVKMRFQDQPEVYNQFLDIMKDFKSQLIDTPGVIRRVSQLFSGHPKLIQGFNTFLPVGYRIECSSDPQQSALITVITPSGTIVQSTREDIPGPSGTSQLSSFPPLEGPGSSGTMGLPQAHVLPPEPANYSVNVDSVSIEPAVQYVQKIKQRCDETTYRRFLEILGRYHNVADAVDEREVSAEIAKLFKDDPDLRSDFRIFMPEKSQALLDEADESLLGVPSERRTRSSTPLDGRPTRRKSDLSLSAVADVATVPQKRKRKVNDRERERDIAPRPNGFQRTNIDNFERVGSPTYAAHLSYNQPAGVGLDEVHFFDRVKRAINNRDVFNEFLRLVNLFTCELIDTARLVREARNFLGDGELMRQFREILCWDDRREREQWILEEQQQQQQAWARAQGQSIHNMPLRPGRINTGLQQGSYRRISTNEAHVQCSGRDDMCKSVLNDEWVSHPTWSSEDSGFVAHKKNVYEEALHRSEEERHEYDFHIEAIVRTIAMLEPINNKIAQLSMEERAVFKLKPNFGGSGKSIHQRIIKKIYGREAGLEVLQAMQETPALAIPVVLIRLKEKEEVWKRAQREWNKVWRMVDARNYLKSLDHQAINFKTIDKKAITAKAFVSQIEAARDEQIDKRASYIDPLFTRTRPKHHLAFEIEDVAVLQDTIKITLSLLDRMQGQINATDRKKIEGFLRSFVPLFCVIDPDVFNHAFLVSQEGGDNETVDDVSSAADEADTASAASACSRAGSRGYRKGVGASSGDLRKKLLKSEQAKSSNRKTRGQDGPSPAPSRPVSPGLPDSVSVDGAQESKLECATSVHSRPASRKHVFFTNNLCYVLLRLLEVVYSRLCYFKNLTASIANDTSNTGAVPAAKMASIAQIAQLDERATHAEHYYDLMLESCERLFDNEIEQHVFEEQMRYMFGVKHAYRIFTIDKVLGSFIKQIQHVLADARSQELLELLKRDRALSSPTNQDQLNSRRLAENIIGPDENVYRIDWIQSTKTLTIQLLGKDDSSAYDAEILAERWQSYIDSYVSENTTHGLPPARLKRPFLKKNLPGNVDNTAPHLNARGSLEIRVCVRTYRLFYVPGTEDFLERTHTDVERTDAEKKLVMGAERRKRWLDQVKIGRDWLLTRTPIPMSSLQPQA